VNLYNSAVLLSDAKFKQNMTKKVTKKWTKSRQLISSKTMFEVFSLRTNTSSKSFAPLINSHVDSRMFKAAPNFNQPLLQFVDGVEFPLVNTTLHDSPDLVINWIERSGLFGGHKSGEIKSGVSRRRTSTVSRARCAGAVSCWKIKFFPETCRITGSSFCRRRTSRQYAPFIFVPVTTKNNSVQPS